MMEELKSCPFCGRQKCVRVKVYPTPDLNDIYKYAVVCDSTHGGCGSESGHYNDANEAIKYWNKRDGAGTW